MSLVLCWGWGPLWLEEGLPWPYRAGGLGGVMCTELSIHQLEVLMCWAMAP